MRTSAPIFAADEVIEESAIEFEGEVEDQEQVVEKFKDFLDSVTPRTSPRARSLARPDRPLAADRYRPARIVAIAAIVLATRAGRSDAAFPVGANGKVAWEADSDGDLDILVANTDGSDPVNLTNASCWKAPPRPSGTRRSLRTES